MRPIALITIPNTTEICVVHIPQSTGQVFLPIFNPIIVEIASIFATSGVGFIFINLTVPILVLIAIIE